MKKTIVSLLVIGLMLLAPMAVLAEVKIKPSIPNTASSTEKKEDGYYKTYPIYVEPDSTTEKVTSADFTFVFGSAINDYQCKGAGSYSVSPKDTGTRQAVCSFASTTGEAGEKIQVGTITVVVKENALDEDCTIQYMLEGATGSVNIGNPETGSFMPYEIIVGGLVLVAGVYFVTSRKSKLFNI